MKNLMRFTGFLFVSILLFGACEKNEDTYEALVPEYTSFDEFRTGFKVQGPTNIKQSGKIYFKDDYIFVNDQYVGIHVIDNSNPSNPQKIAFYNIPGNVDIAILDNVLFADSYIDLVAFDISNILQPVEISRMENAFPEVLPPTDDGFPVVWYEIDRSKGVVTGWKKKKISYDDGGSWWFWRDDMYLSDVASESGGGNAGVAGSMARFMLHSNYLYSIAQPWILKTIDVSQASQMQVTDSIQNWREMETLFRLEENLFVGTTTGMIIYDLSDPAKPAFVSDFNHVNACDPVVVENDIAYVTLRTGNACFGNTNQLDVIDISDIENPLLLKSYPFFNPHGLGIDNGTLFICDGADGLKIFDATNPLAILSNPLAHFENIDAFDVIPLGDKLILIGQDGLFQYNYTDAENISLISYIDLAN